VTKNDVQRLKGLLISAGGNIAALKGECKSPERMNANTMRCLVKHWQEAGREIVEILGEEVIEVTEHEDTPEDQELLADLAPLFTTKESGNGTTPSGSALDPVGS